MWQLSMQQCQWWGSIAVVAVHLALRMLHRLQVRKNRHIEIIPLSTGCLGACTYCKTKHARGVLGSYTLDAIVSRARQAVADPEVWHGRHEMLGLTSRPAACSVARQAALPWHQWEHLDQLQLLPVQVREIWLSSEDTGAWGEASSETAPQGAHGDSTAIHGAWMGQWVFCSLHLRQGHRQQPAGIVDGIGSGAANGWPHHDQMRHDQSGTSQTSWRNGLLEHAM
jgi:hypothetical protein